MSTIYTLQYVPSFTRIPYQLKEVYELLSANYVEDDQAAFRFQYSAEFLKWYVDHIAKIQGLSYLYFSQKYRALQPPGYHREWHVAVRVASNKKIVAFIAAVPLQLRVRDKYVNFPQAF